MNLATRNGGELACNGAEVFHELACWFNTSSEERQAGAYIERGLIVSQILIKVYNFTIFQPIWEIFFHILTRTSSFYGEKRAC